MSEESNKTKVYSQAALFELTESNPSNTYIAIHENVYDVTEFLDEHPGGEEALKEHQIKNNLFRDATESFEDVGHSMDARDLMHKYQIGVLENKKPSASKTQPKIESVRASGGAGWTWIILPALASIGLAFVYQYFSHRQ